MRTAYQKGQDLEEAVESIERMLLSCSGEKLSDNSYSIENRKIVIDDGVKHEFDVWVDVQFNDHYTSTYIFECKNVSKPVSKNDIIIFAEKIEVAEATKGIFVATQYSSSALAQAKKYKRMELLVATEREIESIEGLGNLYVHFDTVYVNVSLGAFSPKQRKDLKTSYKNQKYKKEDISHKFTGIAADEIRKGINFQSISLGEHYYYCDRTFEFSDRELMVDGQYIATLNVKGVLTLRKESPAIRTSFNIENRGESIIFDKVQDLDGTVLQPVVCRNEKGELSLTVKRI